MAEKTIKSVNTQEINPKRPKHNLKSQIINAKCKNKSAKYQIISTKSKIAIDKRKENK